MSSSNNDDSAVAKAAKVAGAVVAGVGLLCGAVALLSGSGATTDRKTMKAPGKPGTSIYRDEFVGNPKGYFADLRKK